MQNTNYFFSNFLRAPLDTLGEWLLKTKDESEQIFDEYLHVNPSMAEKVFNNVVKNINDKKSTIIIKGYKGCGKSTFAYFLQKNLKYRGHKIDFEFIHYPRLLERGALIHFISKNITDDVFGERLIITELLLKFVINRHAGKILLNLNNTLYKFLRSLQKLTHGINIKLSDASYDDFYSTIYRKLGKTLSITNLFAFIFLWDIIIRLVRDEGNKGAFIILDNLDALVDYTHLGRLVEGYSTARDNLISIFTEINANRSDMKFMYNPIRDYTFIFFLRETTLALIREHRFDKDPALHPEEYDFSTVIPKEKIISKRLDYLSNTSDASIAHIKNETTLDMIELYNAGFFKGRYFRFFNDDYRTSIDVLFEFVELRKTFIQDYLTIKKSNPNNTSSGSDGLLIRILCNVFLEKEYYVKIFPVDEERTFFTPDSSSVNTVRLLLTFLRNDNITGERFISINEIFEIFDKVFDSVKSNNQRKIIDAIWYLFSLRLKPFWNHLVTFDKLIGLESYHWNQLDSDTVFKNLDRSSTLKITDAGIYFLEHVYGHFECYSCQASNKSTPLFDKKNAEYNGREFEFDAIIHSAIECVKERSIRVKNYYENNFIKNLGYDNNSFLQSNFSYHIMNGENDYPTAMFHIERVIHSHIDYLDVYRRYVINLLDHDYQKKEANENIIKYIKQYIDMFGYYDPINKITYHSDQSMQLCKYFDSCIKSIVDSGFTDFTMPIDRKTGKELTEN